MNSVYTNIQIVPGIADLVRGFKVIGTERGTGVIQQLYYTKEWQKARAVADTLLLVQETDKIISA